MSYLTPDTFMILAGLGGLVSLILVLLLFLHGVVRDLRLLRHVRRSLLQFRLRTLLLGCALVQVAIAILTWKGEWVGTGILFCAAVLSFFAWCIWTCLADAWRGAASRRWKHITRPRNIGDITEKD